MLAPKKVKYRKKQRRGLSVKGKAFKGNQVSFGEYGLQAMSAGMLTARQIEAARIAITRHVKRGGKIWIRIFPDFPYTKKPAETRMGKGKGSLEFWATKIEPGRVLFEIAGVDIDLAQEAIKRAQYKLPIRTRFLQRMH